MGQVIFADKEFVGDGVQRELFVVVFIDVVQHVGNQHGGLVSRLVLGDGGLSHPVDLHQKLHENAHGHQVPAVTPVSGLVDKLEHQVLNDLPLGGAEPEQVGVVGIVGVKAGGQAGLGGGKLVEKGLIDPENDPLVRRGDLLGDPGLVKLQGADEQHVPGQKVVNAALDGVVHVAAQKEIDLKKVVVMELHIVQLGVTVVEDLKALGQHVLPGVKGLGHERISFPTGRTSGDWSIGLTDRRNLFKGDILSL